MDYTSIYAILQSKPPRELAWAQVTSEVTDKNNNFRQWDWDIFAPRSGDYTVCYSRGDRAERGVAIVVHKSVVKSVVKKSVYSDRIIAIKLQAEPVFW